MPKKYICVNLAKQAIEAGNVHRGIISAMQSLLDDVPAADVEEVRHGKWIFVDGYVTCSECGARPFRFLNRFDFDEIDTFKGCPHCRAKMDGKNGQD